MTSAQDAGVRAVLAEHAEVIRTLGKRAVHDIIEIERRLIEAKKLVGHGGWLPWLEREFGWSDRTARNFMSVAELAAKSETVSDLNIDVRGLYLLARRGVSAETIATVAAEAEERAGRGERLKVVEIARIIPGADRSTGPVHRLVRSAAAAPPPKHVNLVAGPPSPMRQARLDPVAAEARAALLFIDACKSDPEKMAALKHAATGLGPNREAIKKSVIETVVEAFAAAPMTISEIERRLKMN